MLDNLRRKSVVFVQRFGSFHPAIVAQPPLICQYPRVGYGNNPALLDVEKKAARLFEAESALYYASGYLGNAILLQGLASQYDVIFVDEESHYSVFDGAATTRKPVISFAHRDPEDLRAKLRLEVKPSQKPLVICDGVFPTTGEISPLHEYDQVLGDFDQSIICVDDAHATGVIGSAGKGTLEYCAVRGERRYSSGTLSKAIGGHGGIITGTRLFIENLSQNSRIHYGSSPVPTPIAAATAKALGILMNEPEIRQRLWENVLYAKTAFRRIGFHDIPDNPVPIICLSQKETDLEKLQQRLFDWKLAVLYLPGGSYSSVPKCGAVRVSIFSTHSRQQIDRLVNETALSL